MPGFLILMFAAVFGVTLVAVGLGWHFVEQQRRKRVTTMLTTVSSTRAAAEMSLFITAFSLTATASLPTLV